MKKTLLAIILPIGVLSSLQASAEISNEEVFSDAKCIQSAEIEGCKILKGELYDEHYTYYHVRCYAGIKYKTKSDTDSSTEVQVIDHTGGVKFIDNVPVISTVVNTDSSAIGYSKATLLTLPAYLKYKNEVKSILNTIPNCSETESQHDN
ncbi:MAG: hypothetical protein ACXVCY_19050 [Pseudobdellovibrionaceae bacterium]